MKWTKKLPKKAGWYWFKEKNWVAKIYQIHQYADGCFFSNIDKAPTEVSNWPGLWAGPIREPK